MFYKRIKNSYAIIFPLDGLLIILQEDKDNQQNIIEYDIPALTGGNPYLMDKMFDKVTSKFDKTIAGVCIYINREFDTYKNTLITLAKKHGIKNLEIVEECKIESFEVICQLDIKLENRKIILTFLNCFCYIWNGLTCTIRRYHLNAESVESLLITTEFPPDIIIYESSCEKYFNNNFINELFPNCEIFYKSQEKMDRKNSVLNYINMLYQDKSTSTLSKIIIYKINTNIPKTIIHVGISFKTVSGVYYFNGKQREFAFSINPQVGNMLITAAERVNGEFGCICIVPYFNYLTEFNQKWAKNLGFKKVKIIDQKDAEYAIAISQLSINIKPSDIVWIFSSNNNYNVWQDNIFQMNNWISKINNDPPEHFPNYIIFKDQNLKISKEAELKNLYPQCQFLFCNCQHTDKTALRCAQIMAENYFVTSTDELIRKDAPKVSRHSSQDSPKQIPKINQSGKKEEEPSKAENMISETEVLPAEKINKRTIYEFPKQITINNDQIKATGIDLGTSRCCAAVNRKNGISTVLLDYTGQRLLPSYVAYNEENFICGNVALNHLRHYSKSTVFDSKRIIGRKFHEVEIDLNWTFRIYHENDKVLIEVKKDNDSLKKTAEDVAADLLKHVKQKSEEFQGTKLYEAVITVPAAFTDDQKEATTKAAKLAGWQNVILLPESVAASFAYFNERPIPNNSNVLVFDLGGGTLDVCIC